MIAGMIIVAMGNHTKTILLFLLLVFSWSFCLADEGNIVSLVKMVPKGLILAQDAQKEGVAIETSNEVQDIDLFDFKLFEKFKWKYNEIKKVRKGIFHVTVYHPGDGYTPTFQKVCVQYKRGKCVKSKMVYGLLASGGTVFEGVMACDIRYYPFGTLFYSPKNKKTYQCQDTGGAIKFNDLDVYVPKGKVKSFPLHGKEKFLYILPDKIIRK